MIPNSYLQLRCKILQLLRKKKSRIACIFFFPFTFKAELKLYILGGFRWTGIITSMDLLYQIYASIQLERESYQCYRSLPAKSCSKNKGTAWRCPYNNCMEVSSSRCGCFRLWLVVQPMAPINLRSALGWWWSLKSYSKISNGAWSLSELQDCWSFQVGC